MGRVLRRKADGRHARFVILLRLGYGEDPASGAHEAFLTELLEVADDVADFDATADPEELREWLAPGA